MAAIIRLATAAATAACDTVVDRIDAGAGAGTVKVYSGTLPADGDTTPAGTLLATITLADPAFGAASSIDATVSRAVMTDPAAVNWSASGTAGCYIVEDSTGANVWVGNAGVSGGGFSLEFSSVTAVSGSPVDITSFQYNQPTGA
jgi:hypothetical protein